MSRQQQSESPIESLIKNYHTAKWLMQFPALTVMLWLRRDLGYRMVSPSRIIPVTIFLFVISVMASNGKTDNRLWGLLVFAGITLALGLYQRVKRWLDLGKKVRQHTYFMGSSPFYCFRWVPGSLKNERRLERFADPIACVAIGFAIFHFSHSLGAWLVFSGFCLRGYEFSIHMRDRNLSLDILDGMLRQEQQNQTVEEFEATSGWHKQQSSPGLPTGLGEDLESQITISLKRRKTKKNKNITDL